MAPPGLEVLFSTVQNQLQCREDALICGIHWCMVSNDFKCVGTGEQPPATVKKSELLPRGWNSTTGFYSLVYIHNDKFFILKVVTVDGTLLVHLMQHDSSDVQDVTLTTDDFVTDDLTDHESAFLDPAHLHTVVQSGIIEKFLTKKKSTKSPQSTSQRPRPHDPLADPHDPLRIPPRHRGPPGFGGHEDPFSLGSSDLDPLRAGRGPGGGMVMDPFRAGRGGFDPNAGLPGRLPRGAVPPGARFDPFGPQNPDRGMGRGHGPDPDHMPPPGYDDMFM